MERLIVRLLAERGPMTAREIADTLGGRFDKSDVNSCLYRMKDDGFVVHNATERSWSALRLPRSSSVSRSHGSLSRRSTSVRTERSPRRATIRAEGATKQYRPPSKNRGRILVDARDPRTRSPGVGASRKPAPSSGPSRAWIEKAVRIADVFSSDGDGDCTVYLTLLEKDGQYGLYVGQTARSAAARFRQAKAGVKAGRGNVRRYGVRPLHEVGHHLRRMSRELALMIERDLSDRLKGAGFWVEGGH